VVKKARKAIKKIRTKVARTIKKTTCKHDLGKPRYEKDILATVRVCKKCGTRFETPDDPARERRKKQKKKH